MSIRDANALMCGVSAGSLPVGAIVRTRVKNLPLIWHFGVVVGPDQIASLGNEKKIRRQTRAQFEVDGVFVIEFVPTDWQSVLKRFRDCVDRKDYRLFDWNCESFARYCSEGKARSTQASSGGLVLLTASVWVGAKSKNQYVQIAAVVVGMVGLAAILGGFFGPRQQTAAA